MWDDGAAVAVLLVEEGYVVEDEKGVAVGELHGLEGALFGEDLIDEGREEGVGFEEGGAEGTLDGGFEFLLGGGLESGVLVVARVASGVTYSFLNMATVLGSVLMGVRYQDASCQWR